MSHPLTILAVAVLVLVLLDLASLRWGVDSRRAAKPTDSSGGSTSSIHCRRCSRNSNVQRTVS